MRGPTQRPIPGQSLTREPGSAPWEQPPRYTDPEEAIMHLLDTLTEENTAVKICGMLDAGMPVSTIVHTLLLQGFTQGYWSPDVATLIAGPVAAIITKIGMMAGVENIESGAKPDDTASMMAQLRLLKQHPSSDVTPEAANSAVEEVKNEVAHGEFKPKGLMGMKI